MQAIEHEVLQHALDWLSGTRPWLCTIVNAVGSSPRPVGSVMVTTADGRQVGSVSGGCIEEDLLERLRAGNYPGEQPQLIEFGVSAEENERLGLPCGGRLTLLLQRLDARDRGWMQQAMEGLERRHCVQRRTDLQSGLTVVAPVEHFCALEIDTRELRQCFGPRMRMLLVGAGQLARKLAELGLAMDYEVIVTDPREQLLRQWEGPQVELVQGMPDDVIRERACDRHSVVITLTHDPRIDDMALMEALGTEAWYVGALGSQRTTEKRLARLRQLELPAAWIDRLHAPVGLDIGSKTPIEIAVAIMAQLTQLRRRPAAG
ncbi:MAG: XdhC family protein [Halieaceae bacterium]|jgi:xanthine dehydrogenase accessory factor|nr:XdhC family protein [Halieaceae bacterium]